MSDKDIKAVLDIVRRAVAAAPGTKHEVEQAMEIGHGRIGITIGAPISGRTSRRRVRRSPRSRRRRVGILHAGSLRCATQRTQ